MISTLCVKENLHKKEVCEDSIWIEELDDYISGVIADGCSTGVNSGFASRLLCYLYKNYISITYKLSDALFENIIRELKQISDILQIDEMHLLSTFIPFIYNKETRELRLRVFGDGIFYVNGLEYRIEQNNTPDYIGYQINEGFVGNSMYLDKYPERVYTDVESFIIMSDGFDSFQANQFSDVDEKEIYKLLEPSTSSNYLQRTYNILKKKKFTNSDDVSIISYVKD